MDSVSGTSHTLGQCSLAKVKGIGQSLGTVWYAKGDRSRWPLFLAGGEWGRLFKRSPRQPPYLVSLRAKALAQPGTTEWFDPPAASAEFLPYEPVACGAVATGTSALVQ